MAFIRQASRPILGTSPSSIKRRNPPSPINTNNNGADDIVIDVVEHHHHQQPHSVVARTASKSPPTRRRSISPSSSGIDVPTGSHFMGGGRVGTSSSPTRTVRPAPANHQSHQRNNNTSPVRVAVRSTSSVMVGIQRLELERTHQLCDKLVSVRRVGSPYRFGNQYSDPLIHNSSSGITTSTPASPMSRNISNTAHHSRSISPPPPHSRIIPTTSSSSVVNNNQITLFNNNNAQHLAEARQRREQMTDTLERATGTAALAFRGYLGSSHMSTLCYLCADMIDAHEFTFHLQRCQKRFDELLRALRMHPLCGHVRYPTLPSVEVEEVVVPSALSPSPATKATGQQNGHHDPEPTKHYVRYSSAPNGSSSHAHRVAFNKASAQTYASLSVLCKGCGHHYPFGDMQPHLDRCDRVHNTTYERGDSTVSVSVRYPQSDPQSYSRAISSASLGITSDHHHHHQSTTTTSPSTTTARKGLQTLNHAERALAITMEPPRETPPWSPPSDGQLLLTGEGASAGSYLSTRVGGDGRSHHHHSHSNNQQCSIVTMAQGSPQRTHPARSTTPSTSSVLVPSFPLGGNSSSITNDAIRVPYSSRTTSPQRCRVLVRASSPSSLQHRSSNNINHYYPNDGHSRHSNLYRQSSSSPTRENGNTMTGYHRNASNATTMDGSGGGASTTRTISWSKKQREGGDGGEGGHTGGISMSASTTTLIGAGVSVADSHTVGPAADGLSFTARMLSSTAGSDSMLVATHDSPLPRHHNQQQCPLQQQQRTTTIMYNNHHHNTQNGSSSSGTTPRVTISDPKRSQQPRGCIGSSPMRRGASPSVRGASPTGTRRGWR